MNYCESCHIASEEKKCPKCGQKMMRIAKDNDFCLVGRLNRLSGENIKSALEAENIPSVLMPCGSGVLSAFALPLENYLLYVCYKDLERARDIVEQIDL